MFNLKKKRSVVNSEDLKTVKKYQNDISYKVANVQGIGAREHQEDSFATINALSVNDILRQGLFAIVTDGMGGLESGKSVSEEAISQMTKLFYDIDRRGNIGKQFADAVVRANDAVFAHFAGVGGATMVACIFYDSCLYWISVGDSVIYFNRGNGLYKLNKEHIYLNTLYEEQLADGEIDKAAAESDEERLRLYEFIGKETIKEIDHNVKPLKLAQGDKIFLCSDGVTGTLTESELKYILSLDIEDMPVQITGFIGQKNKRNQDNYTGIIVSCF